MIGCLVWQGSIAGNGYGRVWWKGEMRAVHRLSYELFHGPVPAGLVVHHECGNPLCFNPAHLRAVTHAENMRLGDLANRRKTHCPAGHAYTPENTRIYRPAPGIEWRRCLACSRPRDRERMRRKRAAEREGR